MRADILQLLQPSDDPRWIERLQAMDIEQVLPVLIEVAMDETASSTSRGRAVIALGHLHDPRAWEALGGVLDSDDPVLKARAATALGRIKQVPASIAERLAQRLTDDDAYVRRASAEALGQLGAAQALASLEQMVTADTVEANRRIAATAVERIKGHA